MKPAPAELPASDFATISIDLDLFAEREAMGLLGLEVLVAKAEVALSANVPALRKVFKDTERASSSAARLASLFSRLADYEPEVRAFIEQLLERGPRVVTLAA